MCFFLIFSIALGPLDQLQIFLQHCIRQNCYNFNRSGATPAVAIDISKAFDRVWHAGLFHKLSSYRMPGQIFGLIFSFLSNRQLRVVLVVKSPQENIVSVQPLKATFLVLHFSYYTLMIFLIILSVVLLSMFMIIVCILSVIRCLYI